MPESATSRLCSTTRPEKENGLFMTENAIGSTPKTAQPRRRMLHKLGMWGVLAFGIALSVLAWHLAESRSQNDARAAFEAATRAVSHDLEARILSFEDLLHGLQGLFAASQTVTRTEFRHYLDNMRLAFRYPGIHSVSYAERAFDRQGFEKKVRTNPEIRPAGRADFIIKPSGMRPEYLVLLYVEPFAGNEEAYGLDITADATRRESVDRARDTGLAIASGTYPLASSAEKTRAAISLRLALYKGDVPMLTLAQRRDAFTGMLDITFAVRDLVNQALGDRASHEIRLKIYDQGYLGKDTATEADPAPGSLLHDSGYAGSRKLSGAVFEERRDITVGQRQWQLIFTAPPSLFISPAGNVFPWVALLGGLAISVLLFGLVGSLAGSEQRASDLAMRITADLRASESRLGEAQRLTQELIEALPNPIFYKGTDGHYLGVNKAWEAFFGIPRTEFIGKTVHELYPNNKDVADNLHAMDQLLWKAPGSQTYEARIALRGGGSRDTIYYKATYQNSDGKVAGLIGTIVDITERKLAEKRQSMEHEITRVLAEAQTLAEASPRIIRTICETMGWHCGTRWAWDEANKLLRYAEYWGVDTPEIREFMTASTNSTIKPGPVDQGLVRRTYSSGKPVWIADVTQVKGLLNRAPLVAKAGLHGAFAFPLLLGNKVLGVMEFFHRDTREPDDTLIRISQSIGSQIGQFIQRKETEQRYRTIFENAAVGITRVSLDGILTDANQKFFDMLEYKREDIIGKHIKEITHPEDYGQGAQLRGRLADGAVKSIASEKRFLSKSGKVVWARRTLSVVNDDSGKPEYLVSVVEDITEGKLADKGRSMEHAITRVLAEAQTLAEASPRIIQIICETMGWHCGTRWEWDRETGLLRCREGWGNETPEIREFIVSSAQRTIIPEAGNNQGLVQRTLAKGRPVWVADIARDRGLKRAALAAKAGLHGFFGFPLMLGNEVLGMMEFFHRDIREPDDMQILIAQSIGSQIGQFIQRKRAEENLQFAATHDALTRLPNRYLFSECLLQALARAQRNNTMLSIMFLDLDHFKIVNDTLGHEAGDAVLKEVAARLGHCVRKTDILSRRGGDEFVVLFEDLSDSNSLKAIAQKMLAEMSRPFLHAERFHHVTISIGISVYPVNGNDIDTLLKNADTAMYQAKEQGRNAYRFYSE